MESSVTYKEVYLQVRLYKTSYFFPLMEAYTKIITTNSKLHEDRLHEGKETKVTGLTGITLISIRQMLLWDETYYESALKHFLQM